MRYKASQSWLIAEAIQILLVSGLDRVLGQHVQPQVDTEGDIEEELLFESAAIDFEKMPALRNFLV